MTKKLNIFFFIIFFFTPYFLYEVDLQASGSAEDIFKEAENEFDKKNYSRSLSLYEKVISVDPGFTKGYRGVVKSYTALGDPQGAVIYMESLFLENPERAEVLYGLGYALYNTEKYKEAKIYFEKAVGLNPDLAAAWNNIAVIYHFVFPDYKKAREYYEKAIEISKKTKDDWVLKIAEENLAYIPKEADALKPIKENLTLEEFIDNFISMIEESDEGGIRRLVVRHKKNCEEALDLFLKDAMLACVEGRKEDEKKRLLFLKILEREYRVSFNSPFLKNKLDAYNKLNEDEKKKIVMGEKLLEEGLKKEEKGLYLDARNNYQKAISHFFEIKDKNRTGTAFLYLGDIYRKMKKYSLANEAYSNALRYFIEIMEKEKEALALSSLGITNFFLNEFSTSLEYFKRSLKTYKFLNDEESVKAVERNIKLIKAKINKAKKGE